MTAQQKLDAAQRKLDRDFDKRVREYEYIFNYRVAEAAKKRAEEYFGPEMLKELKEARAYKGAPKWVMTSEQQKAHAVRSPGQSREHRETKCDDRLPRQAQGRETVADQT